MADPNIHNLMTSVPGSNMVGGAVPPPVPEQPVSHLPPPTTAPPPPPEGDASGGLDALLTVGRQLTEQMQSAHQELTEQLSPDGKPAAAAAPALVATMLPIGVSWLLVGVCATDVLAYFRAEIDAIMHFYRRFSCIFARVRENYRRSARGSRARAP